MRLDESGRDVTELPGLWSESDTVLPTVIRGCFWDEGWEFDAPCIIYSPFFKYGHGGNCGHLYDMVEDVCIDLAICSDDAVADFEEMREELERECQWRRWSMKGFKSRKNAMHIEFRVRWFFKKNGELDFEVTDQIENDGPFKKGVEVVPTNR